MTSAPRGAEMIDDSAPTAIEPAGDDPAADDPTGDDPAADDPAGDDPVGDDPANRPVVTLLPAAHRRA